MVFEQRAALPVARIATPWWCLATLESRARGVAQRVVRWLAPRLVPFVFAGASTGVLLCAAHQLTRIERAPVHRGDADDALTCNHAPRYRLDAGVLVISSCD